MNRSASSGLAGLLFGVGLVLGGMTQPSKVIGFLDIAGEWDPSLALVMGGAIAVFLPLFRIITRRRSPLFADAFALPKRSDLNARLFVGAAMFGVGWGLAGYCPGPAITSVGSLAPSALLFTGAMVVGFVLAHRFDNWRARGTAGVRGITPALTK